MVLDGLPGRGQLDLLDSSFAVRKATRVPLSSLASAESS